MRPQDVEKIAESVVASFSQEPGRESGAGCGNFSVPAYTCPDSFACDKDYYCGGQAEFGCSQLFTCPQGFFCSCIYTAPTAP
jgi:hypothetical protein